MESIKKILESLSESKRQQLMAAFDLGVSQHVLINDDNKSLFIGVNVETIQGFHKLQEAGRWAVGTIR